MRSLGWNCQGIYNESTVSTLRALIKAQCPNIIFLCETKAYETRMQKVASQLRFSEVLAIRAVGRSVGICLMWSNAMLVEVIDYNSQLIVVRVKEGFSS